MCLLYLLKKNYTNNFSTVSVYDFKDLEDNFEKVMIDFKAIKIQTHREIEKYVEDKSIEAQLKTISRGITPKIRDVWNHFTLKIPYKSGYFQYELKTKLDIYKLKMHFELKGETYLYVQKDNPKIKRLYLGFLD